MKEICVAFTPDENYMVPTCVAILSMLRTKAAATKYKFIIVISNKFDKTYLKYLVRIGKIEADFDYEIRYISSDIFDEQKITTKHLSTNAYYRLILADVLTEYDKCMYHDGDILVNSDLTEMFNVDIGNCYVAGIKSIVRHQNTRENDEMARKWGFSSFDNYILSGDLILNLSELRKDNMSKEFIREMNKGYPSEDQDVINKCCYGRICFLPLKFCMMNRWLDNDALLQMKKQVYEAEEIADAQKAPAVVHFAGANTKPWCNLRTKWADKWWEYAKEILDEEEYVWWLKRAEQQTQRRDWRYLKDKTKPYDSFIIFGYSAASKRLYGALKRWGHHIECFIDNDAAKQGHSYEGCMVLNAKKAVREFKDSVIINASQRFKNEIKEQLYSLGG